MYKINKHDTDIFLNQLIQFYSNNATNLYHLTTHSTTVLPHKMAIVLRPQIYDVTSPYVPVYRLLQLLILIALCCQRCRENCPVLTT